MTKIDNFKNFVKENPNLIKYVKEDKMTWQKFYELYDLYDDDENIWNEYLKDNSVLEEPKEVKKESNNTLGDMLKQIKNIDVDKVQSGITSLQKTLGLVGDLFAGKNNTAIGSTTSNYKPRPVYRNFED